MIARRPRSHASRRRGVVLILVLSMLGLLAVIGVSFAAFSGQARSAARVYSQKLDRPQADSLIEFAIRQLINDTTNPMSALYGHSLKRDMYGNDAAQNGFYDRNPDGSLPELIAPVAFLPDTPAPPPARWRFRTNIPSYVGYDFTGWILAVPGVAGVAQSFEVVRGDNSGPTYILEFTGSHYINPNNPIQVQGVGMTPPVAGLRFSLDGRYRRAFNGTGMAALTANVANALAAGNDPGNRNPAQFANFRVSGGILSGDANYTTRPYNVNLLPMDEDYDAPDLENWFLAAQSADGRTIIPSFHRPGILSIDQDGVSDMEVLAPSNFAPGSAAYRRAVRAASKILTPRPADHPTAGFSSLEPRADGTIEYPVDNDGDGNGDSVWLDLGYPVRRSQDGTLYKPLFSFMVVGTNGRLPLNTAGNLNLRSRFDDPTTPNFDEAGAPLFDHASHLGYSPSEVNPSYALQNAYNADPSVNSQFDNVEIPVSLTQLRNILTGTRVPPNVNVGEQNFVRVNGQQFSLPNNVYDPADDPTNAGAVDRSTSQPVAGRWGEPDAIPPVLLRFPNLTGDPISPALDRALNFSSSQVTHSEIDGAGLLPATAIMPAPVRPGQSPFPDGRYLFDGLDNNFDTLDAHPARTPVYGPEAGPNLNPAFDYIRSDLHDNANMPVLASERVRRFVTPIDATGIGLVARYNQSGEGPPGIAIPYNIGPDGRGRVNFMHYFRPPGVPLDADDFSIDDPARPDRRRLIRNGGDWQNPSYAIARTHHNRYHGFHSHLFPGGENGFLMGGMPYDRSNNGPDFAPRDATGDRVGPTDLYSDDTGAAQYVGTFTPWINSSPFGRLRRIVPKDGFDNPFPHLGSGFPTTAFTAVQAYPLGSPLLNDPNEMNLYWPDLNDMPFGPSDLEWLYRFGDVDGLSLQSRLADLAPISFVEAADAETRRRLFSIESWDRIEYAFANDNPVDIGMPITPPALSRLDTAIAPPASNTRFGPTESANFEALGRPNPAVTHGGRRINLNHPFPHSYDPFEPVRQKWITETYQTLKTILPPHAIDTPQELAKLGQFVVNIVDFRDPDNTITIWQNPDVCHLPARRVTVGGTDYNLPPSIHLPYRSDGTQDLNFDPSSPLIHYGMEYQPVALNEVLGFQFSYAREVDEGEFINQRANRLFIEVVNMLSQPGQPATNASDLDLQGWDFVLVKEDDPAAAYTAGSPYFHPVFTRPDPITGQIPANLLPDDERPVARDDPSVEAAPYQARAVLVGSGEEPARDSQNPDPVAYQQSYRDSGLPGNNRVPAIETNGDPSYFVFTGTRTDGAEDVPAINEVRRPVSGNNDPRRTFDNDDWALIPAVDDPAFNTPTGGPGRYFWLYLRRPANPLLPPDPATNPMVVVDSIRFPFSSSNGSGQQAPNGDAAPDVAPTQSIYSVQRPQPYRGGQLVPDPQNPSVPLFLYGSTEQARPAEPNNPGDYQGYRTYFAVRPGNTDNDRRVTTTNIYQTLGRTNYNSRFLNLPGPDDPREAYDYFPFNDRDFMSVAELLLVPACPPGLFTKQFAEWGPSELVTPGANAFAAIPPQDVGDSALWPHPAENDPIVRPGTDPVPGASPPIPHQSVRTYPYLAHEFYYTSDPSTPPGPHLVGGPSGAGWHRMLEIFEVPSTVLDAIGPVAQGLNFDWFRQDRRPGQINLNLILDEEVFFGLIDDPRLLDATDLFERSLIRNDAEMPRIVTAVDLQGRPLDDSAPPFIRGSYPMAITDPVTGTNRGFTVFSTNPNGSQLADLAGTPNSANTPWMAMKRSFADFLKQRHGGSRFLFAFGDGVTGTQGLPASPEPNVARDRPYRSLSYYDIHRTLMRPATMEPSPFTTPNTTNPTAGDPGLKNSQWDRTETPADTLDPGYSYLPPDPGGLADVEQIALFYSNPARRTFANNDLKPIVPPIPPRRWFQIPDWADPNDELTRSNASAAELQVTDYNPVSADSTDLSNAVGIYPSQFPLWSFNGIEMRDPYTGTSPQLGGSFVGTDDAGTTFGPQADGSSPIVAQPSGNGNAVVHRDMRRHPYYRTEMMQKLTNLTTPRTHQYAVWVTVGLFEVVRPGDRAQFIPDELGPELGISSGSNVRYRSFFYLDRSRATGFNPLRPGDYRDVIVYSRRIE